MKKKFFFTYTLLLYFSQNIFAQPAYDGINDHLFIGYTNVGKASGIEIQFEGSINEFLAYGVSFNYLINTTKNFSNKNNTNDTFEKFNNFVNSFDVGIFAHFHPGIFFNSLNERIDPFVGVDARLKTVGANIRS